MKDEKEAENIRVAVRCRPMNEREIREQAKSCFVCDNGNAVLTNLDNPAERYEFCYDHVYGCDTPQPQVFQDIGVPILDRAFGGYNGTIFAYGQTGSGKTFSMTGVGGHETLEGLIPRMNKAIFERIKAEKQENPNKLFLVECSFFEIYNEIIYDLLDSSGNSKKNKGGLEIKEHSVLGIYVKDLQERVVESREEVIDLMAQGAGARTVGATQMNAESSRSHSIFIIKIHQKDSTDETKNIFAKINLVDLAGSERAASTGAQGDRLKEGANINKSLSALGNVINALVEVSRSGKKVFIPYRNSKLTRVLQESLGGNSLCSMLATLSPANINFPETLSTLKYASRAKSIKVNAKKNEASSQISQLNEEIAALKKKLMEQTEMTFGLDPKEKDEIVKKYEKQIQEMDRVRLQTWEDKARLSKQHEMERKKLAKEKALADQRILEERTKKWRLLEEKGDIELMIRALRDLVVVNDVAPIEDQWLADAHTVKALEAEIKDHRTLILVFKDSLDKDVDQWSKRIAANDAKDQRREDSATTHMTANQLNSKLQNLCKEAKQLADTEQRLVGASSGLINAMMSEVIRFKEQRALAKATPAPAPAAGAAVASNGAKKDDENVKDEREKGLCITLAMVQKQRLRLIESVRTERKRIFNFAHVTTQFLKYITSNAEKPATADDKGAKAWAGAKANLTNAAAAWEAVWQADSNSTILTAEEVLASQITYAPVGDVAPLGLESKAVGDDGILVSSKKADAKFVRMNSPQFWQPDEQDQTPIVVLDFEVPRFLESLAIRGGRMVGTTAVVPSKRGGTAGGEGSKEQMTITFRLKPTVELVEARAKYQVSDIRGDHEQTYELLSHVMSWLDLLKTTALPTKLFLRPPVRFLHDIVSMVVHNTHYAKDLFTDQERDYGQLTSKTDRAEYLSKILEFVQQSFTQHNDTNNADQRVVIAATASNILAGKEPTDTLKFVCFFALAALDHAIQNPPPPPPTPTQPTRPAASSNPQEPQHQEATPEATNSKETQEGEVSTADKPVNDCYVKKIRVLSSLSGKDWHLLGEPEANHDWESIASIPLPPAPGGGAGVVGRYLKIEIMAWQHLPLFQLECFGRAAQESDGLVHVVRGLADKAFELLTQLLTTSSLLLEEARASWERAKDVERAKQEELSHVLQEVAKLKQQNAAFEKQIKDVLAKNTQLQKETQEEAKKLKSEKERAERATKELQESTTALTELKKKHEQLEQQIEEREHAIKTTALQQSEQKQNLEELARSKHDLEVLCNNLRTQLQSKDQQEGHQESKMAGMFGDLMAVNVQLDEYKRKFETSEQLRKEQEQFASQLHTQLQEQRAAMCAKEQELEAKLKAKHQEAEVGLEQIRAEKEQMKTAMDDAVANEASLKQANRDLAAQAAALQEEIDAYKLKMRNIESNTQATAPAQENTSSRDSAAVEAGEKLLLEAQTKELRCQVEMEKMEARMQIIEAKHKEAEHKLQESVQEREVLVKRVKELEEQEEELQLQLQVVTDERDSARQKEEQLFSENNEKDQEIERIRDGYGKFWMP
ncbi:TPA: hypothetical protein N0F65_004056 [Lagenidium giganteum]|uniref:Kinesin motor domain-containing protein n=1 Tax=Lagenidium giganteum TaxID=4803 RepID=A0AAV2Z036_9STRA|nr:TPA: hypothetical protein N0F65_004056 [Lagenidium giganteum]